jgi:hypothetical protein
MPHHDASHLDDLLALSPFVRTDHSRAGRTGMPEVILAERKSTAQCLTIAAELLERDGRALLSRVSPELLAALHERFPARVEAGTSGATAVVRGATHSIAPTGGQVGVLTAGTSDIAAAEEAVLLCRELGCTVQTAYDVGVAGIHRLREPLHAMLHAAPVDVLIVAAGMDGALPPVVAGLVDVPVIGLPTSVGYGLGGGGVAALLGMLQSCVPGLAVVNIDNGIGAGAMAARIANRAAAARQHPEDDA